MSGGALGTLCSGTTGALTSHYQRAGTAVHNLGSRMDTVASTERTNASAYREVEQTNADRFASIMSDTDPTPPGTPTGPKPPAKLQGTDVHGNPVSFDATDVQSIPLKDSNGNVIGVSFPTKPSDPAAVTRWAGMNRTSDTQFSPATPSTVSTPSGPKPSWAFAPAQNAPWSGGGTPVYVHAHANPNQFAVNVNTGTASNPNWTKVRIDGTTHGQVIASNQHYQQAAGANPNSPLVLMSCSSARPGGTAASSAAAYLQGHGENRDVYAPTGTGIRRTSAATNTSFYGVEETVDASGNKVPGSFQQYPAQPTPPSTP